MKEHKQHIYLILKKLRNIRFYAKIKKNMCLSFNSSKFFEISAITQLHSTKSITIFSLNFYLIKI